MSVVIPNRFWLDGNPDTKLYTYTCKWKYNIFSSTCCSMCEKKLLEVPFGGMIVMAPDRPGFDELVDTSSCWLLHLKLEVLLSNGLAFRAYLAFTGSFYSPYTNVAYSS